MRLDDALDNLAEVRARLERDETYRGYRSATVAWSSVVAFGLAGYQLCVGRGGDLDRFVVEWLVAAGICLIVTGFEMAVRVAREPSPRSRRLTRLAVELFLPSLVAGAIVTAAVVRGAPEFGGVVPGLWSILFGLGVCASARVLPPATQWVGAYYLVVGGLGIAFHAADSQAPACTMLVAFGVGQLLAAAVLYFGLERRRDG